MSVERQPLHVRLHTCSRLLDALFRRVSPVHRLGASELVRIHRTNNKLIMQGSVVYSVASLSVACPCVARCACAAKLQPTKFGWDTGS